MNFTPYISVEFEYNIPDYENLPGPVFYIMNFGDGTYDSGEITSADFNVLHDYDWSAPERTATIKVLDSAGGVGVHTTHLTINKVDTSTEIISSITPAMLSQLVTFTATVNPILTGLPNTEGMPSPTGTIDFFDGATWLGTVPVSTVDNVTSASFSTPLLPVGSHSITVIYSGDNYFNVSNDNTIQEIHYKWGDFQSPVDFAQYKIGRTVPLKFIFTDYYDAFVETTVADVYISYGSVIDEYVDTALPTGGQYHLNIDTSDLIKGILTITVKLDDGTSHYIHIRLK
jgi:hypothetical protein